MQTKELAQVIHEGETELKLGLPQGLMASGFFANAYMLGFDAAMKKLLGLAIDEGKTVTLIDYCRYVDDLRLVVAARRRLSEAGQEAILQQLDEFVTQQLNAHCERIGASQNQQLQLSRQKRDYGL